MVIFGVAAILLAAGGAVLFLMTREKGSEVHRRLAELNLDAPVERAPEAPLRVHRMLDEEQRQTLERKLSEAGWYEVTPVKMLLYMATSAAAFACIAIVLMLALRRLDALMVLIFFVLLVVGFAVPNKALDSAIATRKKAVQRALPDFLDMVCTTVEAGTALSGAIAVAMDCVTGPLKDELQHTTSDIRLGRSRTEALAAMAQRLREPDLTTTITTIIQAEKVGGNVGEVLASLASEARERRMLRAEEFAAQIPVKMVFPMAAFMLPSLLLIIFSGIVSQYIK